MSKWWQEERNKWDVRTKAPTTKNPLVVTQPVNKGFNPKVQQPNLPQKSLSVKPSSPTSTGYNPQQASQISGTYNPQDATAILQPQKSIQNFTSYEYDHQAGRIVAVNNVGNLTDREKMFKDAEAKQGAMFQATLDAYAKENRGSLNYDSQLDQQAHVWHSQLQVDFQSLYDNNAKEHAELEQSKNNANSQEEKDFWQAELTDNEQFLAELQSTFYGMDNQMSRQVAAEHDRNQDTILGQVSTLTGAILDTGVGKLASGAFNYTLGSGDPVVPSLADLIFRRPLNFVGNLTERNIEHEDGSRTNTAEMSVGDKWRTTRFQKAIMTSLRDDDTTGTWERLIKWSNPANMVPGVNALTERQLKGRDVRSSKEKRKGTFDPTVGGTDFDWLQETVEGIGEQIFVDPGILFGVGEVKALTKLFKFSKAGAKTGRAVNRTKKFGSSVLTSSGKQVRALFEDAGRGDLFDSLTRTVGEATNWRAPANPKGSAANLAKRKADVREEFFGRTKGPSRVDKFKESLKRSGDEIVNRLPEDEVKPYFEALATRKPPVQGLDETDAAFKARKARWADMDKTLNKVTDAWWKAERSTGDKQFISDYMKKYFPKIYGDPNKGFDFGRESLEAQSSFAQVSKAKRAAQEAEDLGKSVEVVTRKKKKAGYTHRRKDPEYQKPTIRPAGKVSRSSPTRPRQVPGIKSEDQADMIKQIKRIRSIPDVDKRNKAFSNFFEKYPLTPSEWLAADEVKTFMRSKKAKNAYSRATKETLYRRAYLSARDSRTGIFGEFDEAMKGAEKISDPQILKETAQDAMRKANTYWKDAVITGNPAYYVNNEAFGITSAVTEAGPMSLINRFGVKKKLNKFNLSKEEYKRLGGFVSSFDEAKLKRRSWARKQEFNQRAGLFITRHNQGLSNEAALQDVAASLGEYGQRTKAGQAISTVLPFWEWQKFITKRVMGMPLRTPRGANFWSEAYTQFYEKPLDQLPDEDQEYVDPDTDESYIYNPTKAYEGKAFYDGEWHNTPFNAFTPSQLAQFGVNPVITSIMKIATNRDKYGRRLDSKSYWERFAESFPQFNVVRDMTDGPDIEKWLAKNSAFPKSRKTEATNGMDALKRFMGWPTGVEFDLDKFNQDKRAKGMRDDWFTQDFSNTNTDLWSVQPTYDPVTKTFNDVNRFDYDKMLQAQIDTAIRHGYTSADKTREQQLADVQNNVYGTKTSEGLFNKYDTNWTREVKQRKQEARDIQSGVYADLDKIADANTGPDGEKIDPFSAEGTKYIQNKRLEWEKNQTFIKNPELRGMLQDWWFRGPDTNYKGLDLTDPNEYFKYREFIDSGGALREAQAEGLAKYKASDKGKFWTEYHRLKKEDPEAASIYYQKNFNPAFEAELKPGEVRYRDTDKGKFWDKYHALRETDPEAAKKYYKDNYKDEYGGKAKTPEQQKEFEFWQKYLTSSPVVQAKMKEEEPQYFKKKFKKRTWAEIDEARDTRAAERLRKLRTIEGFSARRDVVARGINRKADKAFLGQKKLSPKWKVR